MLLAETNPEMTFCQGHDNAILGIAEGHHGEVVVVYDTEIIIFNLIESGMTETEARKHYAQQIGNHTAEKHMPIFVDSLGLRMVPPVFEVDITEVSAKANKKTRGPKK